MKLYNKIKNRVYSIIGPTAKGDVVSAIFDILLGLLIIASCTAVVFELIGVPENVAKGLLTFEYVTVGIFVFEFLLRIWTAELSYPECKNKWESIKEYVTSFDALIDIISILSILINRIPKELAFLRLLKLLKLVRLIKMTDYVQKFMPKTNFWPKVQQRIHDVITKDDNGDVISKIYDIVSVTLIMISVAFIALETFALPVGIKNALHWFEVVIACLFALEYIVRVWTAPLEYPTLRPDKARMKYIFSFMAIIDLLSIVPILASSLVNVGDANSSTLGILKIFKLCKVLRLVKASRYVSGIAKFGEAIKEKKKSIIFSIIALLLLIMICSLLMYAVEHESNGEVFENGFSGLLYGLSSIADIGIFEGEPVTQIGMLLSSVMVLLGGCIFGVPVAIVADSFGKMISHQSGEEEDNEKISSAVKVYSSLTDDQKVAFKALIDKDVSIIKDKENE